MILSTILLGCIFSLAPSLIIRYLILRRSLSVKKAIGISLIVYIVIFVLASGFNPNIKHLFKVEDILIACIAFYVLTKKDKIIRISSSS